MWSGLPPLIIAGRETTLVAPRNRLCRGRVVESPVVSTPSLKNLVTLTRCWSGLALAVAAMLAGRVEMRPCSWKLGKWSKCVSIRFSVGSCGLGGVWRPRTITGAAAKIITGSPVILGPVICNTRWVLSKKYVYWRNKYGRSCLLYTSPSPRD